MTLAKSVKGTAKLIRYTQEPEQTVALAAKLCYSDADTQELMEQISTQDTAKFINMLIRIGHLSPIEHASFTFALDGVSRALLAQITRHRIASFSVKSQRYVGADKSFNYIIPPAIEALGQAAITKYTTQMQTILEWYLDWQSQLGVGEKSNEDARFILPNAAETKMIVTMNARELMHFFKLRCCERAQWEIRDIAWQMLQEVLKVAPNLFRSCGPSCVTGACSEGKMTCGRPMEIRAKQNDLVAKATSDNDTTK